MAPRPTHRETTTLESNFSLYINDVRHLDETTPHGTNRLKPEQEKELAKIIEAGLFAQKILEGDFSYRPEHRNPSGRKPTADDPAPEQVLEDLRKKFYDNDTPSSSSEQLKKDLATVVSQGKAALDCLIEANLRLVIHIATEDWSYKDDNERNDSVQAGNLGLIHAVQKFDHKRNNKLSPYARTWIKQAIARHRRATQSIQTISANTFEKMATIGMASARLQQRHGRSPTSEELVQHLGWNPSLVKKTLELIYIETHSISMDRSIGDDPSLTPAAQIADQAPSPEVQICEDPPLTIESILETLQPYIAQNPELAKLLDKRGDIIASLFTPDGSSDTFPSAAEVGAVHGTSRATVQATKRKFCSLLQQDQGAQDAITNLIKSRSL